MHEKDVLEKLNAMHTDVLLIHKYISTTKHDVEEHELILRGESKMNGLVGDVRNIQTAQATSNRLWLFMVSITGTVIAWLGLSK